MSYVPWTSRNGGPCSEPRTPASAVPASDRTRLAHQFRHGPNLADDSEIDESFTVASFAMGSTKIRGGALKFMRGFGTPSDKEHSRLLFNFSRRWIYVYAVPLSFSTTPPVFIPLECEIPFEDIATGGVHVVRLAPGKDGATRVTMTITTRRPARFYSKIKNKAIMRRATERDFVFSLGPKESTPGCSFEDMKVKGYIIREGHAGPIDAVSDERFYVPASAWLTWQFELVLSQKDLRTLRDVVLRLGVEGKEEGRDLLTAHAGDRRVRIPVAENAGYADLSRLAGYDFGLRYLMEGLITHGVIIPSEITELSECLKRHCENDDEKAARVLRSLFNEERVRNIDAMVLARSKQLSKVQVDIDENSVMLYHCLVTPTRLVLLPPEVETSTDAIRNHLPYSDRFLRVEFVDEGDGFQVNPTVLEADQAEPAEGTVARVRRAMMNGLNIAGRHYVFLAYGASSARQQSCWFLAEDPVKNLTVESVKRNLGLERLRDKTVASFVSKMAIPFSRSQAVSVHSHVRKILPDVLYADQKDKDYCESDAGRTEISTVDEKEPENKISLVTDGVGRCGWGIARQAAKASGASLSDGALLSAFQFTCGGIKGLLSVWPGCDTEEVYFRQSQVRYRTGAKTMAYGLNVVEPARFKHSHLSRQSVVIMNHLGVPDAVFESLFILAMREARGLLKRSATAELLEEDLGLVAQLSDFPVRELHSLGFKTDPLLLDICRAAATRLLSDYRYNARLRVDQSVRLMGVADELNVLSEHEVFCQYDDPSRSDGPTVVLGACAIMRDPVLHPGDIQLVHAVDRPELRHLRNVIVFSVQGQPLPQMLSRGNLSGDTYSLIWDPVLIPSEQVEPSSYAPPEPAKVKKVTDKHLQDFVLDYLRNDVRWTTVESSPQILEQLCDAHLAIADRFGPQSENCKMLADEVRKAADFQNTGKPAELSLMMEPRQWPTFLGPDVCGRSMQKYESRRILGKLYKLIKSEPHFIPTDIRINPEAHVDIRLAKYKLPASYLTHAYKLKQHYDSGVKQLMKRHRLTEAEAASGIVLRNPHRRTSTKEDVEASIKRAYVRLVQEVRTSATKLWRKKKDNNKSALETEQIYALAAYQVTYMSAVQQEVEEKLGLKDVLDTLYNESVMLSGIPVEENVPLSTQDAGPQITPAPLISFPWVFWRELCSLPNVAHPQAN